MTEEGLLHETCETSQSALATKVTTDFRLHTVRGGEVSGFIPESRPHAMSE